MRAKLILFACLLPVLAKAQDQTSGEITFLESGVICAPESVGTLPAPGTIAGVTNVITDDPPFVTTLNRVPAAIGVGFGAKAMASDPFGIEDVTITIRHPAMGPEGVTAQSYATRISGESPSLSFYQFDFPYELRPGKWLMEARRGDKLLYRSQFEVVPAQDMPELAGVCNFEELLS